MRATIVCVASHSRVSSPRVPPANRDSRVSSSSKPAYTTVPSATICTHERPVTTNCTRTPAAGAGVAVGAAGVGKGVGVSVGSG